MRNRAWDVRVVGRRLGAGRVDLVLRNAVANEQLAEALILGGDGPRGALHL